VSTEFLAACGWRFHRWAVFSVAIVLLFGCRRHPAAAFTELNEARRLSADLRLQFNRAADASNRAVMADTDEVSVAFAHDTEQTTRIVESDAAALASLLQSLGFPKEIGLLEEFGARLSEYRKLDAKILELAVENTNLKAQRLSFGPAREAADQFCASLASLSSKDRCRLEELVAKATLAIREIQVLHAPHIAEADDATMTSMEKEMAAREAAASDALNALTAVVGAEAPALSAARASLDRFNDLSRQIVRLSRRNSNVRSLELSLRSRPALSAACDDDLRQLQEALAKEGFNATR
jgi:hypothetical protein